MYGESLNLPPVGFCTLSTPQIDRPIHSDAPWLEQCNCAEDLFEKVQPQAFQLPGITEAQSPKLCSVSRFKNRSNLIYIDCLKQNHCTARKLNKVFNNF